MPRTKSAHSVPLPRQLDILQVYRGIAATLVVLYHLTWWGGSPVYLALPYWLPMMPTWRAGGFFLFGHSGVDFFFTLSGFVMVWGFGSDAGKPSRLWSFVKGRFTRIYPTYWIVFALHIAFYIIQPGIMRDVLKDRDALWRGFWLAGNGPWHVPPAGTLPYELALYIFFALSFLVGPWLYAAAVATWCGAIVAQWTGWHIFGSYPTLLSPQMLEFHIGSLTAVLVRWLRPQLSGWWLAGMAAVYMVIAVADSIAVIRGFHQSVLTFALPYALLIFAGAGYELRKPRRYPALLMLLGNASFSIYLTHYYLIWEINGRFFRHPSVHQTIGFDGQRTLVLIAVLTLGVLFWALVERPLLQLMHRARRAPAASEPLAPPVLALSATAD